MRVNIVLVVLGLSSWVQEAITRTIGNMILFARGSLQAPVSPKGSHWFAHVTRARGTSVAGACLVLMGGARQLPRSRRRRDSEDAEEAAAEDAPELILHILTPRVMSLLFMLFLLALPSQNIT